MSMLAEPRRRSKYSVDPRGLNWSNDNDKFGQKMMEKMGWSKGKGLGANEDGKKEHVSVEHKSDTRGVGCTKSQSDNWIAHQDDFDSLLSSLNEMNKGSDDSNEVAEKSKVISLEEKSKTAKGRVHYMKFTKGKDLSSKKNEELDCIFGRRKKPSKQQELATVDADEKQSDSDEDKSHGVITIKNTMSINDYFSKKMAEIKSKRKENNNSLHHSHSENQLDDIDGDIERPAGLGFGRSRTEPVSLNHLCDVVNEFDQQDQQDNGKSDSKKSKKRKRKDVIFKIGDDAFGNDKSMNGNGDDEEGGDKISRKKKKKEMKDRENKKTIEKSSDKGGKSRIGNHDGKKRGENKKKEEKLKKKRKNVSEYDNDNVEENNKTKGKKNEENKKSDGKKRKNLSEDVDNEKNKISERKKRKTISEDVSDEESKKTNVKGKKKRKNVNVDVTENNVDNIIVNVCSKTKQAKKKNKKKVKGSISNEQKVEDVSLERPDYIKIEMNKNKNEKTKTNPIKISKIVNRRTDLKFPGSNLDEIKGYGGGVNITRKRFK